MTNTAKTFRKIYKKSAKEKLSEAFGIAVMVFIAIVIIAGIMGVDLV